MPTTAKRKTKRSKRTAKQAKRKQHIAIYLRVSSTGQKFASQLPDLESFANTQTTTVRWYRDKASGRRMDRPGWEKLQDAVRQGLVSEIVVWRLDRLGRTAKGLTALFDELRQRKVNLRSIRDGLDLSTPAGRLMANVLASIAEYETEVRGERQAAGIAKAKASGKRWGGSKKGVRTKRTKAKVEAVLTLYKQQKTPNIKRIAESVGVTRHTIYAILRDNGLHQTEN